MRTDGVYYAKTDIQNVYGETVELNQLLILNKKGYATWMQDVSHININSASIKNLMREVEDYNEVTSLVAKPKISGGSIQMIFTQDRERWTELSGSISGDSIIVDLVVYAMERHIEVKGPRRLLSNLEFRFIQ